MLSLKPRVWENVLKIENWGDKFNLLMDKSNYKCGCENKNNYEDGKTKVNKRRKKR